MYVCELCHLRKGRNSQEPLCVYMQYICQLRVMVAYGTGDDDDDDGGGSLTVFSACTY